MIDLNELRNRAEELLVMRPAEVDPETTWLVQELEKYKRIIIDIVDYLSTEEDPAYDAEREVGEAE